ncbi:WD40 repeat domain-containing protein [Planctomycetota bacterium]
MKSNHIILVVFSVLIIGICAVAFCATDDDSPPPKKMIKPAFQHKQGLTCVAFSPDGTMAATGCPNDPPNVYVWDLKTGQSIQEFDASHHVVSIGFSPDNKQIFAVSMGGMDRLEVWTIASGEKTHEIEIPYKGVHYFCEATFSNDGKCIAFGGVHDMKIRILNLATKEITELAGHKAPVVLFSYSPDGKKLATATRGDNGWDGNITIGADGDGSNDFDGGDGTIRIWNTETGEEIHCIGGFEDWILSIRFTPDGKYLISACFDGTVSMWDTKKYKLKKSFKIETEFKMQKVKDGGLMATGEQDMKNKMRRQKHYYRYKYKMHISPNCKTILVPAEKQFEIWDIKRRKCIKKFGDGNGERLAVSPDGKLSLSSEGDWVESVVLTLWDLKKGKKIVDSTEK